MTYAVTRRAAILNLLQYYVYEYMIMWHHRVHVICVRSFDHKKMCSISIPIDMSGGHIPFQKPDTPPNRSTVATRDGYHDCLVTRT